MVPVRGYPLCQSRYVAVSPWVQIHVPSEAASVIPIHAELPEPTAYCWKIQRLSAAL